MKINIFGILKLGIVLTLYVAVACVGLSFVYTGTKEVVAQRQAADLKAALSEVFPDADDFTGLDGVIQSPDPSVSFGAEFKALKNGSVIGAAITATGASYSGPATILVGVSPGGKITSIKIMGLSDTPGLGANASSPKYFVDKAAGITFYGQFAGKSVDGLAVKKDNGDVIAITASTISSRAITKVVKVAGVAGKEWLEKGGSQ